MSEKERRPVNEWINKIVPILIGAAIMGAFSIGFSHETRLSVLEAIVEMDTEQLAKISDKLDRIEDALRKQE